MVGVLVVAVVVGACGFQVDGVADDPVGAIDAPPSLDAAADAGADATPSGRITQGLIALYQFDETTGTVAADTSGVAPPLDLVVPSANVTWVAGAVRFDQAAIVRSNAAATKIVTRCGASGEITLEAWITYGALPGWSRLVAMSESSGVGNAAMTSDPTIIGFDLRTTISSYERTTLQVFNPSAPPGPHHLVNTRDASGTKRIFLDGVAIETVIQAGTFSTWEPSYELSVGNTPALDRPFIGDVHLVAIYDRALTEAEIAQNRAAGADP